MSGLHEIGAAIWSVEFLAKYIQDSASRLDGENTASDWEEMVGEDSDILVAEVKKMKMALSALPSEILHAIADGYVAENEDAKARGGKMMERRAEQLRLLRLSGDDTPEEHVPFGPFSK